MWCTSCITPYKHGMKSFIFSSKYFIFYVREGKEKNIILKKRDGFQENAAKV